MEDARSILKVKTISEKFKFWKDIYSCPAAGFPVNQEFIERWEAVFNKIPEDSYLKTVLDRILPSNPVEALEFSDEFKKMQEILPAAERLFASDCFEDALAFFAFFWEYDTYFAKNAEKKKKMAQTEAAHKARSKRDIYRAQVSVLWNYLCIVEQKLHPMQLEEVKEDEVTIKVNSMPSEDQLGNEAYPIIADGSSEYRPEKTIRVLISQETALKQVFRDNKEAIMALLPEYPEESDAKKIFAKAFQIFTEDYLNWFGKTVTGHIPRKFPPRSKESRERSRLGALNGKAGKKSLPED